MTFDATILTVPGLGGSGPLHWQSLWEKQFNFTRIEQKDWETPVCSDWIETISNEVKRHDPSGVILVAHSLACVTVAHWAQKFKIKIKGALLVAPADTEADSYPAGTTGFAPVPLFKLPFRSVVVASANDHFVTAERAAFFARNWGSEFINIGEAGHVNVASGHGEWEYGLELLKQFDQ